MAECTALLRRRGREKRPPWVQIPPHPPLKMKKDTLKINLVQKKPHKVYKAEIQHDFQIKDLCKFLRNNKDKVVGIVINGKHTKFNSFAGRKRFAAGYEQASDFVFKYTKELFEEMQEEIDKLRAELDRSKLNLEQYKEKYNDVFTGGRCTAT